VMSVPGSAGNVGVVFVIVAFLVSILSAAGCPAGQSFHKAHQADG